MTEKMKTPAELGYRFPAEWEPHAATWLSWPHRRKTWPGGFEAIPKVWAGLARALAPFEPVRILAGGPDVMSEAQGLVGDVANVTLYDIPTNDAWTRDHGPTFLASPPGLVPAMVEWQYNAWGGKYQPCDLDDDVPRRVAELTGRRRFEADFVLEGGSIDSNGLGTVLTTTNCLLNPNRNPQLTRGDLEVRLKSYLGAKKILWLSGEILGDDTDGHVDQLARFVGPRTVLAALGDDATDENYASLAANYRSLQQMTDQDGRPLDVSPLPMPRPIYNELDRGQRVPASYANFYIANGVVIVPQFDDPADREAMAILAACFPDREICGLPARDLVRGRGAYHCVTQQEGRE
jgi:agmatine deiminase